MTRVSEEPQKTYTVALSGRSNLLGHTPDGPIGAPERQIFSNIYDTLITLGPDLSIQPGLAEYTWNGDEKTLRLRWPETLMHDQSTLTATNVVDCLRKSARKIYASFPKAQSWFNTHLQIDSVNSVQFENITLDSCLDILRLLTLQDFGIYRIDPLARWTGIGSGPYIVESESTDGITLIPFPEHKNFNQTLSRLHFAAVNPGEELHLLRQGKIQEYFEFSTPHALESHEVTRLPSPRANLGLLVINPRSEQMAQLPNRQDLLRRCAQAFRDNDYLTDWALPKSVLPFGYISHGQIDYLDLAFPETDKPPRTLRVGVTNQKQELRLARIFRNTAFRNWTFEFIRLDGYADRRIRSPETKLDCAFLALRGDRGDPKEFFEFLDPNHPTNLFEAESPHCKAALSALMHALPEGTHDAVVELEKNVLEQAVCFPVGYYFDVRVISTSAYDCVGHRSLSGMPRYLTSNSAQLQQELLLTQAALAKLQEVVSVRATERAQLKKILRAQHDLKGPLSALKCVFQSPETPSELAEIARVAWQRIHEIVATNLDARPARDELAKPTQYVRSAIDSIKQAYPVLFRDVSIELTSNSSEETIQLPGIDLKSILGNLLRNSAESIHESGAAGVLRVKIEQNEKLWIEVSDNGRGFEENFLKSAGRIAYSTKSNGQGIGLMRSWEAVNNAGGELELLNLPEGGARVTISIPNRMAPAQ